ncbi:hypothetical protein JN00_0514 [Metamycoplasma subdolum]|uniref:Uncharacterized protein n=1 Tax=Metamycoplasma subdolum TaxID=92407 RepID=A0A3M0A205_9BACT|nr:hypothetical protein [Metamycoplasma subdolum]RMA77469.1 hypothetical protein JN00_0514 [Metamycoplasma subdolum]WPB50668.1 hypothetical protein R9C05_00730 [Metamycoplasma subdolum]
METLKSKNIKKQKYADIKEFVKEMEAKFRAYEKSDAKKLADKVVEILAKK